MSKKGDARIARALERQLKQSDKSARLVARIEEEIAAEAQPRIGVDVKSIFQMFMEWNAHHADIADSWSWGPRAWTDADWIGVIVPKLGNFKTMRWHEIEAATTDNGHHMHHSMPVETVCDECQTRLLELEKVDGDIYRFRLGNKRRLWGFRILNVFEILWYDPLHRVYPTDPD